MADRSPGVLDTETLSTAAKERFTAAEVARHDGASDCWVIVHGAVYDVTSFVPSHPGGVAAISKVGRAGADVTASFERIGHTAAARQLLSTFKIGELAPEDPAGPSGRTRHEAPEGHAHAVAWHADRRRQMLEKHPEIARLAGDNLATPLIALCAGLLHAYVCVACGGLGPTYALLLAYTLGAWCKMCQFAMCHDICHGVAGSWLRPYAIRHTAMSLLTLPSMGGESHHYYAYQHIGHHASLGTLPEQLLDRQQAGRSTADDGPGGDQAALATGGPMDADSSEHSSFMAANPLASFTLDAFDGDLPSPGTILLLLGSEPGAAAVSEQVARQVGEMATTLRSRGGSGLASMVTDWMFAALLPWVDPLSLRFKVLAVSPYQAGHLLVMLIPLQLTWAFWSNPLTCAIGLLGMSTTPAMRRWVMYSLFGPEGLFQKSRPTVGAFKKAVSDFESLMQDPGWREIVLAGIGLGLHTWLWVGVLYLLCVSLGGGLSGLLYLTVAELCLHGFAFHPYLGYFLSVHRSRAADAGNAACQPTTSTYSVFASTSSFNLNYHVEHHDFPNVPWSRLPAVRAAAPEFYDGLDHSNGFYETILDWLRTGHVYTYSCMKPLSELTKKDDDKSLGQPDVPDPESQLSLPEIELSCVSHPSPGRSEPVG